METRIHPETGEILRRDIRPVKYTYRGESIVVDQPAWYPAEGDEGILTSADMDVSDKALRILKSRHESKFGKTGFELGDLSFD